MHGFRQAAHKTLRFSQNAFGHVRNAAIQIDRGLGRAMRLYTALAPTLAPVATQALGTHRARQVHEGVTKLAQGYGDARAKIIEGHRMGQSLAHAVRKEGVGLGL